MYETFGATFMLHCHLLSTENQTVTCLNFLNFIPVVVVKYDKVIVVGDFTFHV